MGLRLGLSLPEAGPDAGGAALGCGECAARAPRRVRPPANSAADHPRRGPRGGFGRAALGAGRA